MWPRRGAEEAGLGTARSGASFLIDELQVGITRELRKEV
jgi:hypothetical protein